MNKIEQLQQYLQTAQVDAAFITNPDNVFYVSGFRSNPHERLLGVMIFKEAEPFLICPKMEMPDAKAAGWTYEMVGHEDTQDSMELLREKVQAKVGEIGTLGIEKNHLTVDRYEALQERFNAPTFHSLDDQMNTMRVIKDEDELVILREAAQFADYAIEVAAANLKEGMTELELMTIVESALKERGIKQMSFETTILGGEKAASPHGSTGSRPFTLGDFVLLDLGVVHKGYCSDITRTLVFGEPGEKQREVYETVLRAEQTALEAVKPGIKASELDRIARDVIEEAGFGEYFTHRLGHGLGVSVHEFPSIHGANDMPMEAGMVFTIEPGIYIPGEVGVRIEDDVAVTADGYEVLTKYPKEMRVIS